MSEIGTAYVRVRPLTTSFRAEAQSGISSAFSTIGKVVVPTIALVGLAEGVRKSVRAAELKQVVTGQLQAAFSNAGLNYSQYSDTIQGAIKEQQQLGFTFDETATSFTRGIRATGSVSKALKIQSVAADVAREQNIGLVQATQLLVRAYNGQSAGLKRLGIDTAKHAAGMQVIDAVERKFAGDALKHSGTATGSQEKLTAAVQETEALIGSTLIPTVTNLNTRLADWLNNSDHQRQIQNDVNQAVQLGTKIIHDFTSAWDLLSGPIKSVVNLLGGFNSVVEKALIVGLLMKARQATVGFQAITVASKAASRSVVTDASTADTALSSIAGSSEKAVAAVETIGPAALTIKSVATDARVAAKGIDFITLSARQATDALLKIGPAAQKSSNETLASSRSGALTAGRGGIPGNLATQITAAGAAQSIGALSTEEEAKNLSDISHSLSDIATGGGLDALNKNLAGSAAGADMAARSVQKLGPAAEESAALVGDASEKEIRNLDEVGVAATRTGGIISRIGASSLLGGTGGLLGGGGIGGLGASTGLGARFTSIGKGLGSLLGRATGIGLTAYIANSLITSFTGFNPLGAAIGGIKNLIQGPPSPGALLGQGASERAKALSSLPLAEYNRDVAQAQVNTLRLQLAQDKASHSTIEWRTRFYALQTALGELRGKQAVVTRTSAALSTATDKEARAYTTLADQVQRYIPVGRGSAQAQVDGARGAREYVTGLLNLAAANKNLSPLEKHNTDLLIKFINQIHRIPSKKVIQLFVDNTNANASIAQVFQNLSSLQAFARQAFNFGPSNPLSTPFDQFSLAAGTRGGQPGSADLGRAAREGNTPSPLAISKRDQIANQLALTGGQTGKVRISALNASLAQSEKDAAFALKRATDAKTKKTQTKWLNAYRAALGNESQFQGEITSINKSAETAAKGTASKARNAAENAALSREQDVASAAKTTLKHALKLAGLGKATAAKLIPLVKKTDDAEIAVIKAETTSKSFTASQQRSARGRLKTARAKEKTDIASIRSAVQTQQDDAVKLQISQEETRIATGKGSLAKLNALQAQQEALEKKSLRDEITRYSKRANNAALSTATRLAASSKANAAENQLLSLGAQDASRAATALNTTLKQKENAVAAANKAGGGGALQSAYDAERAVLHQIIDFDAKQAKNWQISATERAKYASAKATAQRQLIDLGKASSTGTGYTLAELYASASNEFNTYGSNIAASGAPHSPQNERGDFAAVLKQIAKTSQQHRAAKVTPIIIQHFNSLGGAQDPYAAMRAAKLAAEHLYTGGV